MTKIALKYLGSSDVFIDRATGLRWERGQAHEVDSADADRLKALPFEQWDAVPLVDLAAQKAAAEKEAAEARKLAARVARQQPKQTEQPQEGE